MLAEATAFDKTTDAGEIKPLAAGRWPEILEHVAGIDRAVLDGRHHPCPQCGGTDRFRFIDADAGACLCNGCFSQRNGDGLAAVAWARGCDFPMACKQVADYLGGHHGIGRVNGNGSHHKDGQKPTTPATDWGAEADRHFDHFDAESKRLELARTLGVDIEAVEDWQAPAGVLDALGVGWDGSTWMIPERDASGRVIGISTRSPSGRKWYVEGGKRGLTYARDWQDDDGPVLVVEGMTDTAAGLKRGLCCIGRHTAFGGAALLADLLRDVPADRQIVVMGEFDPKSDGTWPGRDGAVRVAGKLADALNRPVHWALPPDHVKDLRAWFRHQPDATADKFLASIQLNEVKPGTAKDDPPGADEREPDGTDEQPAKPFTFFTAAEFDELDLHCEYNIPGILAAGPVPTVVAGALKTLKTSVVMDLLISLAAQHRFLDRFPVSHRVRVAVMSGESGRKALQNLARRVARSKGWMFGGLEDWFSICPAVPNLSSTSDLQAIERFVIENEIGLLAIDPAYLSMPDIGSNDASSMFPMGKILQSLSRLGERTGCTPVIVHHATKASIRINVGEPMELADMSWSGFAEWAGQWILLSRREKYDPDSDGEHRLWMTAGGRDGHSTLVGVDITEGRADTQQGRRWDVNVQDAGKARAEAIEAIIPSQIVKGNNRKYDGYKLQRIATDRIGRSDAVGSVTPAILPLDGFVDETSGDPVRSDANCSEDDRSTGGDR